MRCWFTINKNDVELEYEYKKYTAAVAVVYYYYYVVVYYYYLL